MKVLVLGVTGMLGNTVFKYLSLDECMDVWGTCRSSFDLSGFPNVCRDKVIHGVDVLDVDSLHLLFSKVRPDVVINCVGLIKQLDVSNNPLVVLPINSMLPHRLEKLCELVSARLIHISTDCVFSGKKGMYQESDTPDSTDLYGKSKWIGEIIDSNSAVTLRTSIIGHELNSKFSLVNWFLSQRGEVKGFTNAIFSGLPAIELARVIKEFVIPNEQLIGLYHVSVDPISKYELLKIISNIYKKDIVIHKDSDFSIDRSLSSVRFRDETGYVPPKWRALVQFMYDAYKETPKDVLK